MNIFSTTNPPGSSIVVRTARTKEQVRDIVVATLRKRNIVAKVQNELLVGDFTSTAFIKGSFSITINPRQGGFSIDRVLKLRITVAYIVCQLLLLVVGIPLMWLFCIGLFLMLGGFIVLGIFAGTGSKFAARMFEEAMENVRQECELENAGTDFVPAQFSQGMQGSARDKPPVLGEQPPARAARPETKQCPECGEWVNAVARKCRFCEFRFE